jgi:signal transduction histidine kinase
MIAMTTTETHFIPAASQPHARRSIAVLTSIGKDVLYLFAMFAMSIVGFVVWVTGLSVTAGLLVLIVGVPMWLVTAYVSRWTAGVDRRLAGWRRGRPIAAVYRQPQSSSLPARLKTITIDPQTWKDLGWLVINSIVGFAFALTALTATAVVIGYITMPLWWWAIPDPHTQYGTLNLGIYTVTSTGWAFVTTALGLLLAPLALLINRGVTAAHTGSAARLLGPSERQELHSRVEQLASTRSDVVDAADDRLRRIERDLHDGAQARLVALAMELGMAEEELASDPEAARVAVRKARREALGALGELRDLSRGLRPALLQERGLGAAADELARRSTVPVTVECTGPLERVPDPIGTAAYFVAAEALTNVNKHSEATAARIAIERVGGHLAVTVTDNGRGGANENGSGLAGLGTRVRALDGTLAVDSPDGGPTTIKAEIPCE